MTLMQSGKRRCDARCYGAKGDDCNCVCGGENHGKGFDAAMKNTQDRGEEMAENFRAINPGADVEIKAE
jgi:hypothetical protein